MEYRPKSSIFIATPMYGGNCTAAYFQSMLALQHALLACNYTTAFSIVANESLITRARNDLVEQFLETDCDYLLFIDADHRFDAFDIIKMIESDVDIICAIPPKKAINWETVTEAHKNGFEKLQFFTGHFVINVPDSASLLRDEKFEIEHGGTGIMLIKRRVFDILKDKCDFYYKNNTKEDIDERKKVIEFFKTSIHNEILLSEDYHFCRSWRETGGKIYAAPWVKVTHIGPYEFTGSWAAFFDLNVKQIDSKTGTNVLLPIEKINDSKNNS